MSAVLAHLRYRRLVEALHACGPRRVGEILGDELRRLALADCRAALAHAERVVAFRPEVIVAVGADRYPAAPIYEVAA
jgi:hypothetical protein